MDSTKPRLSHGWTQSRAPIPRMPSPKVWAGVRANHPEIPKPNKNRARTWYWAGGNATTLDETIALVKSMGIELIFFGSFMVRHLYVHSVLRRAKID